MDISLCKPPEGDADVWFNQIPFEIPSLDNISKEQFERYVLVVSIIEENLKEHVKLKRKLESILHEVKLLNAKKASSEASLGHGMKRENVAKDQPSTERRRSSFFKFGDALKKSSFFNPSSST